MRQTLVGLVLARRMRTSSGGRQGRWVVVWSLVGLACWCGCGVTRTVTMKTSTQSRHQRGHAADVIFHHDHPVAPALDPGPQERDRSQGPSGRALEACPRSCPWPSPGYWPDAGA